MSIVSGIVMVPSTERLEREVAGQCELSSACRSSVVSWILLELGLESLLPSGASDLDIVGSWPLPLYIAALGHS